MKEKLFDISCSFLLVPDPVVSCHGILAMVVAEDSEDTSSMGDPDAESSPSEDLLCLYLSFCT
jgi:hypothetical protein